MFNIQLTQNSIQKLTIEAPICKVTVLEDRALITRSAKINLTQGLWKLTIEKVAPVLVNKSLRAEFDGDYPNSRIDDVRVNRQMLIKEEDKPEEIKPLLAQKKQLNKELEQLNETKQQHEYFLTEINSILSLSLTEIPIDMAWGENENNNWQKYLDNLFENIRELHQELFNIYIKQQDLQEEIDKIQLKINNKERPDYIYTANIETDLMIAENGDYLINFDYIVPNALWRPIHQIRLSSEPKTNINFNCQGCVWQNTGEDWNNVDLILSTARPSLGIEPPLLHDDILSIKNKSKELIIEAREEEIKTTGEGIDTNVSSTDSSLELPGVDDGGEVRNLKATTKATIPSDGKPYRVPLFSFESSAKIEYVLIPEIEPQVIKKTEQVNTSKYPILAGPVDLISGTEFVGKTSILFIAPQEKFALGWGADSYTRVQRVQHDKTTTNHLTQWKTTTITTKLFLSNIGQETRHIKLTERVPISELEQLKVKVITSKTTNKKKEDENGFCHWNLILKPFSQSQTTLVYQIELAPEIKGFSLKH